MNNRQQLVQESVCLLGMPVSPGTLKNRQGLVVRAVDQFVKKYTDRINTQYAAEMWEYGTELLENNYAISFHRGPVTHGWCHSVSKQMVEVTKPNRNGQ